MNLALCVEYGRDDQLIFAQQLGVGHVVMAVQRWDEASLAYAKNRVEQATLTLAGLEGLPLQDAEAAQAALRAAGANGIDLVAAVRQSVGDREPVGRGGALVGPPVRASGDPPGLVRILAAADASNVRLALGADMAGAGVDLDLATMREGDIAECGERLLIVRAGNVTAGRQAFLNGGEVDLPKALLALQRVGFAGPLCAGPPPGLVGDTEWGHKGRAYDLGYLRAILQTIEAL